MAVEAGLADDEARRLAELSARSATIRRMSVRAPALAVSGVTPVGARYSPKTRRRVSPHSPVVTPALAQAIEGGMIVAALARRALELGERGVDGVARRARRARRGCARTASISTVSGTVRMAPSPAVSGEGSPSV